MCRALLTLGSHEDATASRIEICSFLDPVIMKTERPLLGETLDTTNPCAALMSEKIGREPGALVFDRYSIRCQRPKYTNGTNLDDFCRPYLKQYGSEVEKTCHETALATLEESKAKVSIMCGELVHDFSWPHVRKLVPISVSGTHLFDEFEHIRAQLDNKGNICRLYFTTYHPGDNPAAQTDSECAITLIRSREFHASWQQSRSGYSKRHAFQLRMRVGGLQCFCSEPSELICQRHPVESRVALLVGEVSHKVRRKRDGLGDVFQGQKH
jgi:hypothetical protein